jgi:hypothetical protein
MWDLLWIFLAVFWLALPVLLLAALTWSIVLSRVRRRPNGRQIAEPALTTGHGDL